MNEKEFDRLIKGRFFQALLVKWQRKLEAPKPGETFHELYNRARMMEQYERQYAASAAAHSEQLTKRSDRARKAAASSVTNESAEQEQSKSTGPGAGRKPQRSGFCWGCREPGHIKRNCPKRAEAPGRSQVANTGAVGASIQLIADDLTDDQLERMLADRRLCREQALLSGSATNTVHADNADVPAVGPTLLLDVLIEGLPVKATVDTGAQSTIISRSTLHAIGRHLRQNGRPLPTLEIPTVRLYGKDGPGGGRQLTITAQLQLTFTVDGESVNILVFVQPNSEQPCLLGMNAIPPLGITVLRRNGEPIVSTTTLEPNLEPRVARVRLVGSVVVPGQKGRYIKVHVDGDHPIADDFLFEPRHETLSALGVCASEGLVRKREDGTILVPIQNYQGIAVHIEAGALLGEAHPLDSDHCVLTLDEAKHLPPAVHAESASASSLMLLFKLLLAHLIGLNRLWMHCPCLLARSLLTK